MWSVGTILTGLLSFMYDSQVRCGACVLRRACAHVRMRLRWCVCLCVVVF
jgi:hypothetical protein